jgi:cell division transport system permease protein
MVGATRWFIAKPMNIRAIINGAIAAGIAIVILWAMLLSFQQLVPELKTLQDNQLFILLCILLLILGVAISLISTHRSVIKYLKMKLDELY